MSTRVWCNSPRMVRCCQNSRFHGKSPSDGLSYVFHLKSGVRFHDGSEFDAAAAKYSLERILAPGSTNPQRARLRAIRAVEVVDPLTLRVQLSRRSGGLLQSLAFGSAVMVSRASAVHNALQPIGTGPFRFLRWRRGDSITLERNPDYQGPPALLSQVTFKFITDPTAAFAALMAGDVDAFANYPAPESFSQFAVDRRFKVFTGTTEMETVLGLNERVAPLAQCAGAPRDFLRLGSARHHRWRDVRLWHADRQSFPAAQSRLRRSDRHVPARYGQGQRTVGAGRISAAASR